MQEGELVYVANAVSSKEAKWFEELGIHKSSDYYTVEFDTAGGNEIDSQSIKIGKTAKKPKNPTKEGHIFLGWYYLQETGTGDDITYEEKEFDFSTKIISNYSLYAKYSGEAVLMAANFKKAFWQETYRTKITSIVFTKDSSLIPSSPLNSWDVEADKNCANIKAYLVKDETDNSLYKLIVYSEYTIYANPNAANYFRSFSKLKNITFENESFNTSKVTTMYQFFSGCSMLENFDLSEFNTLNVTNMRSLFYGCKKLTSIDVKKFNTSKVKNMHQMFCYCDSVQTLNLSNFNTSNVTTMQSMFNGCSNVTNINLSSFNTTNVTDMKCMFYKCYKLMSLDLSTFDTSKVTNMETMFMNCDVLESLNLGSKFNTSKVESFRYIFCHCSKLTSLDVSNFNTSNAMNMEYMFNNCSSLTNLNLSNFDTSKVTNMQNMFNNCKQLSVLNVSNFDTSNVTTMLNMFNRCRSLNSLNVSSFNTEKVINMEAMFANCDGLTNIDLSSFNTSKVENMKQMFYYNKLVTTIYIGQNWDTQLVTKSDEMFSKCLILTGNQGTNYNSLNPTDKTYAHVDGGISNPGYFTLKK